MSDGFAQSPASTQSTERDERRPSGTDICSVHNITFAVWLGCVACDNDPACTVCEGQ